MVSKTSKRWEFKSSTMSVTYPDYKDQFKLTVIEIGYRDTPSKIVTWWMDRKDMRDFKDWIRERLNDRN